jgi:xylose isomerase
MKFEELAGLAKEYGSVGLTSGKQERLENLLNQYLLGL